MLNLKIAPGYHVNSDKPRNEFLIPLKLTWSEGGLDAKQILYPKAEQVKVGADMLDVFTGAVAIKTEFAARTNATPGLGLLEGKLRYQACDSVSCKRPATLNVQLPVSIQ